MRTFSDIFWFEIKYRLRRPSFYVYLGIALLTGMFYGASMAGAFGPETGQQLGVGGKNLANSPVLIHTLMLGLTQIAGLFIIAAFMAVAVFRDFQRNAHPIFFTKDITKLSYLGGRFLGSYLIVLFLLLFIGVGFAIMIHWPWAEPNKLGPFNLWHYINPYLVSVIPFSFFTGTIFFATVTLSRNELLIYLNAIILLILFNFATGLSSLIDSKVLASLLDPTGAVAIAKYTEYWTVAEKNTQIISMFPLLAYNYLIWLSVAGGILFFTYKKFSFSYSRPNLVRTKKTIQEKGAIPANISALGKAVVLPAVSLTYSIRDTFSQLWIMTKMELRRIFNSPILWILFGVAILLMIFTMLPFVQRLAGLGTVTYPTTSRMAGVLLGSFSLFIIIAIIFWSGELIWQERKVKIDELMNVLPIPSGLYLGSKFFALITMPFFFLTGGMIIAILAQLFQGYYRIELGLYFQMVYGLFSINFILFAVLSLFIQILSPNKYLGFFLSALAYFLFTMILPALGVEDRMLLYMSNYRVSYSDMNGFGPFIGPFLTLKAYWGGAAILLGIIGAGLYLRGSENSWAARIGQLRNSFRNPAVVTATIIGLVLFGGLGSYIYYNAHVLNEYRTRKQNNQLLADFEKQYKYLENIPQPKVTDIALHVDMFPSKQDFHTNGTYILKNKSEVNVDTVAFLIYSDGITYGKLELDRPYEVIEHNDDMNLYLYKLKTALVPGDSMQLEFEGDFITKGFTNSGGINSRMSENGAFLPHSFFPSIGYNNFFEHTDPELRKEYGLPEREFRFPPRTDTAALQYTLLSKDSDWITFACTISTEADQIAIAPGYLQKEWEENGRRYFQYEMDSKMLKFFNLLSARYEVMRDTFMMYDSIPIDLEIYYHYQHTYNLDAMMRSMKQSLAYFCDNFGPYQHKVARIIEFPSHHGQFAQSFPNTISYSESAGFITDLSASDVDLVFYGTAHELAHQWWGHQAVGGVVEGVQFLIESMAQYSAMMVMKKELGDDKIDTYLKHELNTYLKGRTAERRKENPAHKVDQQFYIQYNKGSLIMYALQDYIGEDSLNLAIRNYLNAVKFQEPPFTTTLEWMDYVREVTPDSLQYILTDLFETITLFDNQVVEAEYEEQADSSYLVKMKVFTQKLRDDGEGEETTIPIQDYIDVGIFAREKIEGKWQDIPLYWEKHKFNQDTTEIEILVDSKPSKVGIDPYSKLIDRNSSNNTKRITKSSKEN